MVGVETRGLGDCGSTGHIVVRLGTCEVQENWSL